MRASMCARMHPYIYDLLIAHWPQADGNVMHVSKCAHMDLSFTDLPMNHGSK